MGLLGKQGNKTKKAPPAFASGMRGSEKPNPEGKEPAEDEQEREPGAGMGTSKGAKTAGEDGLATNDGSEAHGYSELLQQHISGPNENGHHHLNLTTFAEALRDKSQGSPGNV